MIHRRYAFFAAVLGLGLVAAAPAPVELASVRATYDVSLKHALPAGLVAVRGRTAIEFRKTCDGYKTTQRFLADMTNAQGNVSRTDFAVTAWESRNGRAMRFDITNMVDGEVAERYKGRATIRAAGPGEVALALPKSERFALPAGTVLPTTQTVAVIRAAERGARSYAGTVFLGGGRADLYNATTAIGARLAAPGHAQSTVSGDAGLLRGVPAWPVLMSYYAMSDSAETPEYEIAADLYANGVIGTMTLIYARFTLKAKLVKLERLSTPPC